MGRNVPSHRRLSTAAAVAVAAAATLFAAAVLAGCASGGTSPAGVDYVQDLQADRLLNLHLSPEFASWLIGPIARMATAEERQAYLALTTDAEARAFIDDFWTRRDPYPERPDNPLYELYEQRAQVADRLYSEGGHLGRRTARGTIYVLYGQPDRTDYQIAPNPRDPAITVWFYETTEQSGLDGRPPAEYYRFIRRDEVTEFYQPLTGYEARRPLRPEEQRF